VAKTLAEARPASEKLSDFPRPSLEKDNVRQSFRKLVRPVQQGLVEVKSIYKESLLSAGRPTYSREIFQDALSEPAEEAGLCHELAADIARYMGSLEGKWLRPALTLLAADFFGVSSSRVARVAAALELIHNATLIHDDIIDESETRRGREAVWTRWGNSATVLMGDLLYAKAFELTTLEGRIEIQQVIAAATSRMCQGELHELESNGRADVSEIEYLQVVSDKTAALMSACTQCGAILSGASASEVDAMRQYGLMLGMAFQITDDVLDYVADVKVLGKTVGNDLANGQLTLPLIHFLARDSEESEGVRLYLLGKNGKQKMNLTEKLEQAGSINYSLSVARRYAERAKEALAGIDGRPEKVEHLDRLANFVVDRRF
jgi:geranylgeranyl pyrophosphate synthase